MIEVFSGGLVYEFTQEPNNYGLVKVNGDQLVTVLQDYLTLRHQYSALPDINYPLLEDVRSAKPPVIPSCKDLYANIGVRELPNSVAGSFITNGVTVAKGRYVDLDERQFVSPFLVFDEQGKIFLEPRVEPFENIVEVPVAALENSMYDEEPLGFLKLLKSVTTAFSNLGPSKGH